MTDLPGPVPALVPVPPPAPRSAPAPETAPFRGAAPAGAPPLLALRGIHKRFAGVRALEGVDLEVHAGEVTAIVGDNGAGKSTLVQCVAGLHAVDAGQYLVDGAPVRVTRPRDAARLGIEVVHQTLALCDNLDIVQNMFLGREVRRGVVLDEGLMEVRAREVLAGLGVRSVHSVRQLVAELSGGQRQAVAIARAVLGESRVVLLDEPTAALGVDQTRQVLDLVRRLADAGLGVVLVSHDLGDVFEVADTVTVLRRGRVVATVRTRDVTSGQVVELITTGRSGELGVRS